MRKLAVLLATIVAALTAGAYWGTSPQAATKPHTSSVHCLVFRFAVIDGKQLVLLSQKPVGEVPCPRAHA